MVAQEHGGANEINPFYYFLIDRELRKEYEEEFGIDSRDTSNDYYTHEEQIEIYAKNILFCIKHKPDIDFDNFMETDPRTTAKLFYVSNYASQLQRKILSLTPALQKSIHGRVKFTL